MATTQRHGEDRACTEYVRLSRRGFLRASGAAAVLAAAPAWLPRVAFARGYDPGSRDVIVQVYLRGGADGLTLAPPYGDPRYAAIRPTLAFARPDDTARPLAQRAIDLDGFFGLARGLEALFPAYLNGHLLIVHAAGSADITRSHFDAQRVMEVGRVDDPLLVSGWLGRHLETAAPLDPEAPLRGISLTDGLTRTLGGGPRALPIPDPGSYALAGPPETEPRRREGLRSLYTAGPEPLRTAALSTLQTLDMLGAIDFASYRPSPGAQYWNNDAAHASLRATAALIKARVGVEAATIDVGGWDTHSLQEPFEGRMFGAMRSLAAGLAAFYADVVLSSQPQRVIVVVLSEFGRRAAENGDGGTEHGRGGALMLMGHRVTGGRVLAAWPGLQPEQLDDGDLKVTIDYRDVLAEVISRRLGNPGGVPSVFPGYTPTLRGVVQAG